MNFEEHLKDLQKTYDILIEALHDMNAKVHQLTRENAKLKELNETLGGEQKCTITTPTESSPTCRSKCHQNGGCNNSGKKNKRKKNEKN